MSGNADNGDLSAMDHSAVTHGSVTARALRQNNQRRVESLSPDMALGIASPRVGWHSAWPSDVLTGACRRRCAAIALWDAEDDNTATQFTTALIDEAADTERAVRSMSLTMPRLLVVADGEVVWWSASADCQDLAAVVNSDGQVHLLARASEDVRSEMLEPGDRLVVLSADLANELSDVELALEMALVDDPHPSSSIEWILAAAHDDGALSANHAAVWRMPPD